MSDKLHCNLAGKVHLRISGFRMVLAFNLILLFNTTVLLADNDKVPIDLEKAIPVSEIDGKGFLKKESKSFFNPGTPENVKQVFLDVIHKIQTTPSKTIRKSKEPLFTPLEFGPVFCLAGNEGFNVYFLRVNQYNNLMGLPFENYYFVVFDKKTEKCSGKTFLIENDFADCYWDNLSNDEKVELVIDNVYRNGTGRYFEKVYYEILNNLLIKKLFVLQGSTDGPYSSEERIIQKKKGSVVVEDVANNSDIAGSDTKTVREIKFNF